MTRSPLAPAILAACAAGAQAQDWLDNFNDGSATDGTPVMWVSSPGFGAEFDVLDADLHVTMDDDTISSPRVGNYFPTGASVRARMIGINGPGRYTVAFADEPTGIKGYVVSFSTCQGGRIELFRGDRLGSIVYLGGGPVLWPYSPEEEFIIQLDVFNGVVSARVWRPGEPFPEPQISAPDANYPDGVASIAIQDFGGDNPGGCSAGGDTTDAAAIVRYAQTSSIPLTHSGCADFNADGSTNTLDVLTFLNAWAGSHPNADFNADGTVNTLDVLAFLNAWTSGCA